jgi:hypothetical protein
VAPFDRPEIGSVASGVWSDIKAHRYGRSAASGPIPTPGLPLIVSGCAIAYSWERGLERRADELQSLVAEESPVTHRTDGHVVRLCRP